MTKKPTSAHWIWGGGGVSSTDRHSGNEMVEATDESSSDGSGSPSDSDHSRAICAGTLRMSDSTACKNWRYVRNVAGGNPSVFMMTSSVGPQLSSPMDAPRRMHCVE